MAHPEKTEGVPVPTVVISVIAVFVAGLLIGGFALRFGSKGDKECNCAEGSASAGKTANKRYRVYPSPHNPAIGPRNALVTIVEASDFQCPFCSRMAPVVKQVQKMFPKDVRLVFMQNPLPMHRNARLAAVASMAAHQQGKFWPYHDLLFRNQRKLGKADLIRYAKQIGLNVARFKKDLENRRMQMLVMRDSQALKRLGVRSTPTLFVNGRYVRGAMNAAALKKVVLAEIRHARALLKKGTPRARLYAELMRGAERTLPGAGGKKGQRNRRTPPREDPNAVYKVDIKGRPWKGAKDAKVVIAEWSDYQCPWCKRTEPLLHEIMKKFKTGVKLVWFDFPLRFHRNAMPAALAAWEVYVEKGNAAYWKFHDKVYANNRNITTENLAKWAKELGANPAKVTEAIKTKKHEKVIRASMMAGQRIGVRGTPTLLVNGRKYRGRRDITTVSAMINAEMKKADQVIGKGGVTLATYYSHIQKKGLARVKYLPGSGNKRAQRPRRRQLDPNAVYKVPVTAKDVSLGPKDALVTIVEWSDFQCPYCKWASCIMKLVEKAYPKDVRYVWRNNPLPFHRSALPAAEAAMAAFAQKGAKGFFAMHDRIYPINKCSAKPPMPNIREWLRALPRPGPKLDMAAFTKYAKEIGLDVARFKKDMESHAYLKTIKAQQAAGMKLGARGTPGFFVNGKYVRGIRPFARFKAMIDREIAAAKKLMAAKRIPRSKVYETIIAKGASAPVYLGGAGGAKPRIQIRRGKPGAKPRVIRIKPRPAMR